MVKTYPELEAEIARRGILKKDIAKCIDISDRALSNKLKGRTEFTWGEVNRICETFFPGMKAEELLKRTNT